MASEADLEAATQDIMRACGQVTAFTILITMAPNDQERRTCMELLKSSLDLVINTVQKHAALLTDGVPPSIMPTVIGRA
jgi:hypothetical protein